MQLDRSICQLEHPAHSSPCDLISVCVGVAIAEWSFCCEYPRFHDDNGRGFGRQGYGDPLQMQLCAVLHSYLPLADDNGGSVPIPIDD